MEKQHTARVWTFGDDINTDLILPGFALWQPVAEQPRHCFSANRPGWSAQVLPGDLIVAGRNFGTGSGRPIGQVFAGLKIGGIVAESFNGLGMRNCINAGIPVLPCPGIAGAFKEGEIAEVGWRTGLVRNAGTGATVQGVPLPVALQQIVEAGGVFAALKKEGFIASDA